MEAVDLVYYTLLVSIALVVLIISYFYRLLTTKHEFFSKQGVAGPDPTIPTGSWKGVWKTNIGEEDLERISKYGKVHGTFDGISPDLIVAEPALIKKVLHDDASHFRSRRAYKVKNSVLRNSLLSIEGNDSKELKHLLSSALSTDKIKKLVPRINKSIDSLVGDVSKEIKEDKDGVIDATKKVKDYLSDVLAFTLFGVEFTPENQYKQQFLKIVEGAYLVKNPRTGFALTPFLFEMLATLDDFVLNKSSLQFLTNICQTTIQAKRKQNADTSVAKAVDFLDLLIAAAEEEKKHLTKDKSEAETENVELVLNDNQLVTQIVSVVLSVVQVARSTLALSLHTLAKLPNVQNKLRFEIAKELQTHHDFTYEFIQSCEYLDMFVGEVLRLYPLEFRLERECADDLSLEDTKLEPGVVVSVPVYAIHRLKEFYPEPETFEPERFSTENASKRDHYTYLPFAQAGANSTNVGIQLGVLITKLAIAVLVNDFKWLGADDSKIPAAFMSGITGIPLPQEVFVKAELK